MKIEKLYGPASDDLGLFQDPDGRTVISVLMQQLEVPSDGHSWPTPQEAILNCALRLSENYSGSHDSGMHYGDNTTTVDADKDGYNPLAHAMYRVIQSGMTVEQIRAQRSKGSKFWKLMRHLHDEGALCPSSEDRHFKGGKMDALVEQLEGDEEGSLALSLSESSLGGYGSGSDSSAGAPVAEQRDKFSQIGSTKEDGGDRGQYRVIHTLAILANGDGN